MKLTKSEMQLIKQYDTPETVCIVTSYPDRHGESAERNAIANYSRELVREMGKKIPVVVIAEALDKPMVYEEDGVLVVRSFKRDSYLMSWQITHTLAKFKLAKQVVLQFEFGVYGGSITTFLTALLGLMIRAIGKKLSVMMHQITDDLGELSEHLGIAPRGLKTLVCNLGMRVFYVLTGLLADRIIVHNKYLATKLSRYVRKEKITVVPHGVGTARKTLSKTQARSALGWKRDEFVIMAFGYLSWYKGSDWVMTKVGELAKKYPDKKIRLVMAGGESGTLKEMKHYRIFVEKLYKLATKYNVQISGYVHDKDKVKYFVGADLVILPHRVAMSESGVMAHVAMYAKPFLASMSRTTSLHNNELIRKVGFSWSNGSFERKVIGMMSDKKLRNSVALEISKQGKAHSWKSVANAYMAALPNIGNERYTGAKYDTQVAV